jgi:protein O-GlcNAc transferase
MADKLVKSHKNSSSIADLTQVQTQNARCSQLLAKAYTLYNMGSYKEALECCELAYDADAYRTDNLLLLGAVHFQLRNFSESIFYNQQCIRVDPNFAEGYSNLGNALKELGDVEASLQFYLKAIKLKPRYSDAYNNLASAYVQLGRSQEAIETYQMALVISPGLIDAHSNLGNLYKAAGELEAAKKCYLEAIRIKPDFAIAWNNLAGVFKDEGQITTALSYYKEAIRLCPEFADAHSNLGNALRDQGQLLDALASYQTAVKLRPDFAIAHGNLATCHYDLGDVTTAIKSYKYAIQLEPNYPDAHNNLGNALRESGKIDDAIMCYRATLRLKPDHPFAYNNMGNAMKDKGHFKEAIHCYVTAIRLSPQFSAAHSNLGSIFKDQGKFDQAIAHYQEAIKLDPLFADAYSNLGNVYKDIGQLEEAIKCYSTAIKIKPKYAEAYSNIAAAYKDTNRIADAITCYKHALSIKSNFPDAFANLVHCLVFICDWSSRDEDFTRLSQLLAYQLQQYQPPASSKSLANATGNGSSSSKLDPQVGPLPVVPSIQPFHALAYPLSLAEMLQIAQRYAIRCKIGVSLIDTRFTFRPKVKSSRLKIAYVSSDFGNHPMSHLTQSIYGLHDRNKFEVTCYALSPTDMSSWRSKIESEVDHFKDISPLSIGDAAQQIFNDGIHVLINLNGYTKGARNEIFCLHPAPLQMSYMGYAGTMGADFIDYMIADNVTIPAETKPYYSEKIISMPHTYFVNDHKQSSREVVDQVDMPSRSQYGISEDSFVFCNFNQLYKIDPAIFTTWMNILKRVDNSVLWLLKFPPVGQENLLKEARARGVREDQIVFTDVCPRDEHIKRGILADLFLDTPLCNAHTTACDILWSGTPMITLVQDKMASRVAASILKAAGLPQLVTTSFADYEELAVGLALDPEQLFGYRRHLETTRDNSAAFDTKRWVKNAELGISEAWRRYESGKPPDHIDVEDSDPVFTANDGLL